MPWIDSFTACGELGRTLLNKKSYKTRPLKQEASQETCIFIGHTQQGYPRGPHKFVDVPSAIMVLCLKQKHFLIKS